MSENLTTDTTQDEVSPHARAQLNLASAMFRYALWPSLATVALGAVLFGVLDGGAGAVSALVGGALACASSLITLVLMRLSANQGPHIGMAASLGGFVGKMLLLFVVMTLLRGVDGLLVKPLGLTMIAVVLVAAAAEAVAFRRTKLPTIVVPSGER